MHPKSFSGCLTEPVTLSAGDLGCETSQQAKLELALLKVSEIIGGDTKSSQTSLKIQDFPQNSKILYCHQ